jgi:hypothetical protein
LEGEALRCDHLSYFFKKINLVSTCKRINHKPEGYLGCFCASDYARTDAPTLVFFVVVPKPRLLCVGKVREVEIHEGGQGQLK